MLCRSASESFAAYLSSNTCYSGERTLDTMPTPGLLTVVSKPIKPDDPSTVEAFELECKEAHKTRREFLIIAKATVLSHEHYSEKDGKRTLDLYEIDDIDGLLAGKALLEEGGEGPVRYSHSSIYRHLR